MVFLSENHLTRTLITNLITLLSDGIQFFCQFTQYERVNGVLNRFFETGIRMHFIDVNWLIMREKLFVSMLGRQREDDLELAMAFEAR